MLAVVLSSSLAFEENQQYEEEKPARQIRVEIPARMNTPTRSYYPDVTHPGSSQVFYTDDGEFHGDYVDEIASEFDDRPVYSTSPRTEKHQASTITHAENDYITFKQSINSHQPELVAQRDQPPTIVPAIGPRSVDAVRGATISPTGATPQSSNSAPSLSAMVDSSILSSCPENDLLCYRHW